MNVYRGIVMAMKTVVLGGKGMLGSVFTEAATSAGMKVTSLDLPEFDITDADQVAGLPSADWIINCAGYTNVDNAEQERELALAVNGTAVQNVAKFCANTSIALLHISTDYVFNGTVKRPYCEDDVPEPLNAYGSSKLAGEQAIRKSGAEHIIARTQSLFGPSGHNFVNTIARCLREGREELQVVDDQISCPTYTVHLAEAILELLATSYRGIINISSTGECSWFEFAQAIAAEIAPDAVIKPVSSKVYNQSAVRPAYSVLSKSLYEQLMGKEMPHWLDGMRTYLENGQWV